MKQMPILISLAAILTLTDCGRDDSRAFASTPAAKAQATTSAPVPHGHCKANVASDPTGRINRCCRADTNDAYFLELGTTSEYRKCATAWKNTQVPCDLHDQQRSAATIWSCETPSKPVATNEKPHKLAQVANALGTMPQATYLTYQEKYVGSRYPACNYFVITAMCMAGICEKATMDLDAADFDGYLLRKGWAMVGLSDLKAMIERKEKFDSVLQRDAYQRGTHGHVLIPVGLSATRKLIVAQASLGTATNEVHIVSDSYLDEYRGGMRIFVRR